jgi:hypothetical protein
MTSIESTQDLGVVASNFQGQETKLPYDIQRDLTDLQTALNQLKENPDLANDQSFQQKILDYLDKYVEDYNSDIKDGSLSPDQQIALSDLNEDLKVKGLIGIYSDGPINNPNSPSTIGSVLEVLLETHNKVNWIDIINDSINSILDKYSK